jgi:predicted component of viral defense system (DUF524 family)
MVAGYDRLAVPVPAVAGGRDGWWVIEVRSSTMSLSAEDCVADAGLPRGWRGKRCNGESVGTAPIRVTMSGGQVVVRILETVAYEWELQLEGGHEGYGIHSTLHSANPRYWSSKGVRAGSYCVVNHLGTADFVVEWNGLALLPICLGVESRKFDFETEYRAMTEDIAGFCQQLLLEWESPTSLSFSSDGSTRPMLLEQFLFLRHFMTEERMRRLLEAIDRNPHVRLVKDREWVPASRARSTDYLQRPMAHLRGWHRVGERFRPAEVRDVRKEDSRDTDPNRFVKFALSSFRKLCADVLAAQPRGSSTVGDEARAMMADLDALLGRRFFAEVGRMARLPLDNQTLQKREGYREVLHGWLLTQAAASLDWDGRRETFDGTTRDVATLYEYWIFLKLHGLLRSLPGMTRCTGAVQGPESFIQSDSGRLVINLKSGRHAVAAFQYNNDKGRLLRIDLHYERTFRQSRGANSDGSYSRSFRPDYTLTIYPAEYATEAHATAHGKVAHLHLDAKYRAELVDELFGNEAEETDEATLRNEKLEAKTSATYRRGDLLKMHTYNDALRHAIGSYVLYPGSDDQRPQRMGKFYEIAPGVGAFVMKPGNPECITSLGVFLTDVFNHQADSFNQYSYLADNRFRTLEQRPQAITEGGAPYVVARREAPCVLLWMRPSQAPAFRRCGFAYCHAVPEENRPGLDLNLSIETGSEFIPCGGGRGARKTGFGWRAKVRGARFLARAKLLEYIEHRAPDSGLQPAGAEHYLLFEFDEPTGFRRLDLTAVYRRHATGSDFMAVTCSWAEILDCIDQQSAEQTTTPAPRASVI